MTSYSQIRSRRSAQRYQAENVEAWFWNHPSAIVKEEQEFIRKEGDIISVVDRVKSPLRLFLEKFRSLITCRMFRAKQRRDQVQSATTSYYSNARFDGFVIAVL